jgi:hypothetical protein
MRPAWAWAPSYRGYPDPTGLLHALERRDYDLLTAVLDRIEAIPDAGTEAVEARPPQMSWRGLELQ